MIFSSVSIFSLIFATRFYVAYATFLGISKSRFFANKLKTYNLSYAVYYLRSPYLSYMLNFVVVAASLKNSKFFVDDVEQDDNGCWNFEFINIHRWNCEKCNFYLFTDQSHSYIPTYIIHIFIWIYQ